MIEAITTEHPTLIIVGGVHGAGKSTLCRELKEKLDWPYVTNQTVISDNPELQTRQQIHRRVLENVRNHLEEKRSFIFEHVMSGHFIDKLLSISATAGFQAHLIFIDLDSAKIALQRVNQRVADGGHHRSQKEITTRMEESRTNFWQRYRSLADSWVLCDNSGQTRIELARSNEEGGIRVNLQGKFNRFTSRSSSEGSS